MIVSRAENLRYYLKNKNVYSLKLMQATINTSNTPNARVAIWLFSVGFLVIAMMIIGAITRLTDSGLSMVEWRPLIGILPPFTDQEWLRVYELYKQYPEYKMQHFWMDIEDFKKIFFWEWFHRFLGY